MDCMGIKIYKNIIMPPITNPTPTKDPSTGILNLAAPFVGDAVNGLVSLFTAKRNRQNALDDWNRQNEYNSPAAQMQRYKEAGLSPHLIYGQTNTAAPVRSTDMVAPQMDTKNVDFITRSQNINQQRLTTDNLAKQAELIDANIALTKANELKANSETDWKNVNTQNFRENVMPHQWDYFQTRSKQNAQNLNNSIIQNDILSKTVDKIKAEKSLTDERKALVIQTVKNYVTAEKLLGQKLISEEQQNEFVKKIDSASKVGGLGIQLLKLLMKR
ncbi:MAG: DNA pilot protein [Microviridae sp.]|nr:MAG: DNA pilot protein [Microviridae sp.]